LSAIEQARPQIADDIEHMGTRRGKESLCPPDRVLNIDVVAKHFLAAVSVRASIAWRAIPSAAAGALAMNINGRIVANLAKRTISRMAAVVLVSTATRNTVASQITVDHRPRREGGPEEGERHRGQRGRMDLRIAVSGGMPLLHDQGQPLRVER